MSQEELSAFYDKLAEITERGTEEELRIYVDHYYPRLPENARKEILFNSLLSAVRQEAREEAAIREIQEKGLLAMEALEEMKKELNRAEKEEGRA